MQFTPSAAPLPEDEAQDLLQKLRRKEATWVEWGQWCQRLQRGGYPAAQIFEETGIEGSYQNLMIVAAQVFTTLLQQGANAALLDYFRGPRSDVLYELRVLNQGDRLAAAELAMEKRINVDLAHDVARAMKTWSRTRNRPAGFTNHPGDAVAYQCWQAARAKKDLQDRSRLIAKGLKFAQSEGARSQIEQLLSDFTVVPQQRAPLLPLYRLEQEEELPRLVPVVEGWPVTLQQFQVTPPVVELEPFRLVQAPQDQAYVPVPGWQVMLKAQDPVALLCTTADLPNTADLAQEQVVVVIDRAQRQWDAQSYWAIAQDDQLEIAWTPEAPEQAILGQVTLILRPKRILDEGNLTEPWQMDD
ncbi:MAG: RuBisCO accumulation factor 1 [Cyanobacteria bacterium P01_G01_bin.54]